MLQAMVPDTYKYNVPPKGDMTESIMSMLRQLRMYNTVWPAGHIL